MAARERDGEGLSTSMSPARLAGKRCIVTGAARGIGAEIARTFAADGATVGVLDVGSSVKEVVAEIDGAAPRSPIRDTPAPPQRSASRSTTSAASTCWSTTPASCASRPLLEITVEDWDLTFDVNVRSMLLTTQVAAGR